MTVAPIQLLVVDAQDIVRAGLCSLLDKHPKLEVLAETAGGEEAVTLATRLQPDVVLTEVTLPDMDGAETTRRIKALAPEVNVLALTTHEDEAHFFEMLNAGTCGYVPKRASPDDLVAAIRTAATGDVCLHPIVDGLLIQSYLRRTRTNAKNTNYDKLTTRQQEVLVLIAEGLSNQKIASQLNVGVRTIKRHRENIMRRLNLHSYKGLAKYARREGPIQSKRKRSAEREKYDGLTVRQREVLTLIAEGFSSWDIGSQLGISARTVERHRENIMKRLNLRSRTDLVKYALRKGLIQLNE
ncbi:MAG: helix-turn-helix transcriptional regulator [Chloroflexi bacterium]|nr:helix-turn-helix transcriptional regulator [Chloroflexota bacterium]